MDVRRNDSVASEQSTETKPKRRPDFFGLVDLQTGKMAIWKNLKKEEGA